MLKTVFTIVVLVALIRIGRDYFRLIQNIRWIHQAHQKQRSSTKPKTRFVICLPLYFEQSILAETIDYFTKLDYPKSLITLVIATTQKEGKAKGSTYALAASIAQSINKDYPGMMHVTHYPKTDGLMAHQINYAAKMFEADINKPDTYFTVYNADSRPDSQTLRWVDREIQSNRQQTGKWPTILQQSTLFTTVKPTRRPSLSYMIASGAAVHQSLWTLTQEMTRFRVQSRSVRLMSGSTGLLGILRHSRIAHCVGHGLFVHGQHYVKTPLPEELLNEDLPYGLLQCCLRQPILPLPLLEVGLSPNKLSNVYSQKTVWFNPFFEFRRYAKTILKNHLYVSKFEVYYLTAQAYGALCLWLIRTALWLGLLLVGFDLGPVYFVISISIFFVYWFGPGLLFRNFTLKQKIPADNSFKALLGGCLYALTDSFGPMRAVVLRILTWATGKDIRKPKTENV